MKARIDFEPIVQQIAQVVIIVDHDLRIVWANAQAVEVAGGDPVGRHCYAVYQGRQTPCEGCHTLQTFETGQSVPNTSTVTDEYGQSRFFDGFTTVVGWDDQGRPALVAEVAGEVGGTAQ
ncbi:MAG: PAS domain-containing protein [Thermodesulfobacteriota bacterium]